MLPAPSPAAQAAPAFTGTVTLAQVKALYGAMGGKKGLSSSEANSLLKLVRDNATKPPNEVVGAYWLLRQTGRSAGDAKTATNAIAQNPENLKQVAESAKTAAAAGKKPETADKPAEAAPIPEANTDPVTPDDPNEPVPPKSDRTKKFFGDMTWGKAAMLGGASLLGGRLLGGSLSSRPSRTAEEILADLRQQELEQRSMMDAMSTNPTLHQAIMSLMAGNQAPPMTQNEVAFGGQQASPPDPKLMRHLYGQLAQEASY